MQLPQLHCTPFNLLHCLQWKFQSSSTITILINCPPWITIIIWSLQVNPLLLRNSLTYLVMMTPSTWTMWALPFIPSQVTLLPILLRHSPTPFCHPLLPTSMSPTNPPLLLAALSLRHISPVTCVSPSRYKSP